MGHIDADYTNEPKFRLNFTQIPEETILSTPIGEDVKVLKKIIVSCAMLKLFISLRKD